MIPESYDKAYLGSLMDSVNPSMILVAGWVHDYIPENVEAIKEAAAKSQALMIYWATEDIQHVYRWSLPFVRNLGVDLVFTINQACVEIYSRYGIKAEHLNFACNTDIFSPLPPDGDYDTDVLLVANHYDLPSLGLYREESLRQLLVPLLELSDLRVEIWGRNWTGLHRYSSVLVPAERVRGTAPFELTPLLYASARIVLGPQNESKYPTQLTMRTFEVLGTGALLLTSKTAAVRHLFRPGHHLIASGSARETAAMVKTYLGDPTARRRIGECGRQLILKKHTYKHRAEKMLALSQPHLDAKRQFVPAQGT